MLQLIGFKDGSIRGWSLLAGLALVCGCSSSATPGPASNGAGGSDSSDTGGSSSNATTGGSTSSNGSTGGSTSSNASTGGAPNNTTTGGTSSNSATGGASTTTDSTGGANATGGTSAVTKLCATQPTLAAGLLTDFETYDGVKPASGDGSWGFSFNGAWDDPNVRYGGLYANSDGSGTYSLGFVGGANGSSWAVKAANTMASVWGGGFGMWLGCFNASSFAGLQFYARGTTPSGKINVSLAMEDTTPPDATNAAGGGTCTMTPSTGCKPPAVDIDLPADWTLVQIPWSTFTAGTGLAGTAVTATGARITGIAFGANMVWVDNGTGTWVPEAAPFDVQIDNVGFY